MRLFPLIFILGCASAPPATSPGTAPGYGEAADAIVRPLLDNEWVVGAAVALVHPGGTEIRTYGAASAGGAAPTADTPFEIGSVTKVFTGLLLASAVVAGETALDRPLQSLPGWEGIAAPPLTPAQLATHTSGLPRMPGNFAPAEVADPYADYAVERLRAAVGEPRGSPGSYDYSNLGAGLLGQALADALGGAWPALLRARVTEPLGLTATDTADRAGGAAGHDADGKGVAAWHFDALAGAGALRSTARDLGRFVELNLAPPEGPAGEALRLAQASHAERPGGRMGLGWHIGIADTPEVRWHNGQTGGFHTFVAFDPERRVGVAVLTNSATSMVDNLGVALLRLLQGLPHALELPPVMDVEPAALEGFVGAYTATIIPGTEPLRFLVTREDRRLFVQLVGQDRFRVYARAPTRFAYRVVAAEIEFVVEAGRTVALVLHQNGGTLRAEREAP